MAVRNLSLILLMWYIASGCGMNVDLAGNPKVDVEASGNVSVNPDFENAAKFCDIRYGYKTVESEECFSDFRDYYKLNVGIDLKGITEYCEKRWVYDTDVYNCEDELISIIKNINGEKL